ncbi:hypothetical protein BDA96_01G353300 [Sorghum bicolor]|uniref:Uncharacterized protein n=1 Tax=Sorghum bicolor TaxID=4558 RepID=A0A921V0X3_SORBI|nr:hypothetical protein BDA96_01G353300 [Sorghum bicolor]
MRSRQIEVLYCLALPDELGSATTHYQKNYLSHLLNACNSILDFSSM